jgi:uncharacterized repeat protein (TIGR04138 family)
MTERKSADELLAGILGRDRRYARDAYVFVSESLNYTVKKAGRQGHVSGRELCEGLCEFALQQFGRLARTVLESWGIRTCEDIGEIVFNMVDAGLLRKTEEDSRQDFAGVLDFQQALDRGFEFHVKPEGEDEHRPAK